MSRLTTSGAVAVTATVALGLVGCGLPQDGTARAVDPKQVPYGLMRSDPPAPASSRSKSIDRTDQARLYLLGPDDQLVGVPAGVGRPLGTGARLTALFALLARGPDETQRGQGLSTALSPGVQIQLRDLSGGVARVQVVAGLKDPSADRLPLSIGQLVLTATSLRGVDSVVLERDGAPVEVPLPGGALTSAPLTRSDYASLVKP